MKTLALGAFLGTLVGWVLNEKQHQSISPSRPVVLDVRYAHKEGDVEYWTHCDLCKTGVIRKGDGKCSFCRK